MIRVSPTSLVLVLIALSAGTILLAWLWGGFLRARREAVTRAHTLRCPLCFFEFIAASALPLNPCPRCGAPTAHEKPFPKAP